MTELIGRSVYLRLAKISDADFIFSLRIDVQYNKYLSSVDGSVETQAEWLKYYKTRERAGKEFYFIIVRQDDNTSIGTIRLYDFLLHRNSFSLGSWILTNEKTRTAALESALLGYQYGFEKLGFSNCHLDVRKGNERVVSFHLKSGVVASGEDDMNIYFDMPFEKYEAFLNKYSWTIVPDLRKSSMPCVARSAAG